MHVSARNKNKWFRGTPIVGGRPEAMFPLATFKTGPALEPNSAHFILGVFLTGVL